MSSSAAEDDNDGSTITRRAGTVLIGTLASRILGAIRDSVIAASFSVAATDAFYVAFTIPNTLRVVLGEGAVSGAFVPVFTEVRATAGIDRARIFYLNLAGAMLIILALVTAIGILIAPFMVHLYAHGFARDATQFAATVELTEVVFPYIFFMGIAALGMGALNSCNRFAVPAFAPALLNVAMIAAPFTLVGFSKDLGLTTIGALAIGALIGGVLQVVAQLPALSGIGLLKWPRFNFRDPYVRKALLLMVPLLVSLGVYQANIILSRLFSSFLPEGAMSYLYYGQRLVEIPQGMFALAIATASLPALSDLRNRGKNEEALSLFRYGLRQSLFVSIPSAVALAVLAVPFIAVYIGRGEFSGEGVAETARSLVWLSLGIWSVASVRMVVPMFMAHNDTRTPVLGALGNLLTFVGCSLLLMPSMGHAGIAAAISLGATVQLFLLLILLRRRIGRLGFREVITSTARILFASAVMGVVAWTISQIGHWSRGGNDPRNIVVLLLATVASIAVFLGVTRAIGCIEVHELAATLRRRTARK